MSRLMKNLDDAVNAIAQELGLDQAEIAERCAFLEISGVDSALLKQVQDQIQGGQRKLVEQLQKHLFEFLALRSIVAEAGATERLTAVQLAYFNRLFAGEYGADYVKDRLRVGVANQRIGLESKWYVGAFRKYLSELLPVLARLFEGKPKKFQQTVDAILKVVFLDMSLALDTYFQADREEILQIKNYAEQIVSFMPSGLMVVDADLKVRTMNRAMCRMLGLAGAETDAGIAAGTPLSAIIQNHDLSAALDRALASGATLHHLVLAVSRATGRNHIEVNISASLLAEKNVLVLIAQDITDSTRSQEELQRFRMALDSSIDAV